MLNTQCSNTLQLAIWYIPLISIESRLTLLLLVPALPQLMLCPPISLITERLPLRVELKLAVSMLELLKDA